MRPTSWRSLAVLAALPLATAPLAAAGAWRAEGPDAGNVNRLALAPSRPETVYAATSGGGVWRSDDGGATWTLPGDEMTSRDVRWVAVDPADPTSVWAGLEASGEGSALWRSRDGGATWAPVDDDYPGGRVHATGAPIAFAPAPARTIYVASSNLHYRTDDGGKSWRDFRVPNQDAYVFAVHPQDPKIVYAGGRGESQNVSRSTDGGKTWRQIGLGLGKNSLSTLLFDPARPTTLYAAGGTFTALFKSTDGGERWTALEPPVGGTSDLYSLAIDGAGVLWAATEDGLLRSADGGATWNRSDEGTGRYWLKSVAVDPRDPRRMLGGAGGDGVFRSEDGGGRWAASSRGLAAGWTERLWGVEGRPTIFAQLSTGLYRHDGAGWTPVAEPFAEGGELDVDGFLFDAASPQSAYAWDGTRQWRSGDGGRSWQEVARKEPSMRDLLKGNTDSVQFASLTQDRRDPKVFYAGSWSNDSPGGAVYKTSDAGKKWAPAGTGLPAEEVPMLRSGPPGTVYALVDDHGVYRTTDGGARWSAAGSGLPEARPREIAVDPTDPTRLFAATEEGLFRSTDAASTWARVGEGIEGDDVEAVAFDARGRVYAGTFFGVFVSDDGGSSWTAIGEGLPNTDVRALVVAGSPARLWAGTAGGSVWSRDLP